MRAAVWIFFWFGGFFFAEAQAAANADFPAKILDETKTLQRLQWSCCADPRLPQPLWTKMSEGPNLPDLYIHVGNRFPITDKLKITPEQIFKLQALAPEFVIYRSKVPVIGTLDEDDYGTLSPTNNGEFNPDKEGSKYEYLKFYSNDSGQIDPRQRGLYHSFLIGDPSHKVQILLLDVHSFRSDLELTKKPKFPRGPYVPTGKKKASLLGAEQWAWLEKQLKVPAALRILISPTQAISSEQGQESWSLFPENKKRLLGLLQKQSDKTILILSGNRLHGEIHQLQSKGSGKKRGPLVLDLTAGGLNRTQISTDIPEKTRVGGWLQEPNFGQLSLDWSKHQVLIQILTSKAEKLELAAGF